MPHNGRTSAKTAAAVARLSHLRSAGVPLMLDQVEAWHLSGGIIGRPGGDRMPLVALARIARDVPDAAEFLPDWQAYACPHRDGHERSATACPWCDFDPMAGAR